VHQQLDIEVAFFHKIEGHDGLLRYPFLVGMEGRRRAVSVSRPMFLPRALESLASAAGCEINTPLADNARRCIFKKSFSLKNLFAKAPQPLVVVILGSYDSI
jgi:hypothetical protein